MKKINRIITAMLATAGLTAGITAQTIDPARKLLMAESVIENYYVDDVNADTIVQEAIVAMLKTLDPHSTYTNAAETKALTEPLNGNFSGIGIQFQILNDTVYVIQTIANGPCEKVGVLPGDRIVACNDTLLTGKSLANSVVQKHLRGPKGSVARLKVVRRSVADTLNFRVTRDNIPLYTVDAAYMAAPGVGYIKVSSFGAETPKEFSKAISSLQKQGMTNLMIDLQDNGGGYLQSAVDLASCFLPAGSTVVYTEGLNQPVKYFRSTSGYPITSPRIVVLTNEYSASASEILTGALQDNDRAVVVGRRTFGKGLVQRPIPFPDGSMMRLTTARYYTPSGRCIQKPYTKGSTEDYANDLDLRYKHGEFTCIDSIKLDKSRAYKTLNLGRTVYGGGGIMPDLFVPLDTTGVNKFYREVRAKNLINQYVASYVEANRSQLKNTYPNEDAFVEKFRVTDKFYADFVADAKKHGVSATADEVAEAKKLISAMLAGLMGRDLFEMTAYYRIANKENPVYNEALRVVSLPDTYNKLLNASHK
jgi:carboxyl-terminal processing protease